MEYGAGTEKTNGEHWKEAAKMTEKEWEELREGFLKMDAEGSFSSEGTDLLFDYLKRLEEDTGIETEFDSADLYYEFSEYKSLQAVAKEYSIEGTEEEIIGFLRENTSFILGDSGIVIVQIF